MTRLLPLAFLSLLCLHAAAQTIRVSTPAVLAAADSPAITIEGLPPHARVALVAERVVIERGAPVRYRAGADFVAGADGIVDLGRDAPVAGSYRGADVRGLFWSMVPIAGAAAATEAGVARMTATVDGKPVASRDLRFDQDDPQVQVEPVAAFPGAVFARPRTAGRRPVVIALGGSEGGARSARELAMRLAAHGFAAVGLPYYSPAAPGRTERELPALPASFVEIPVDRLNQVRDWLAARDDVDDGRIALYGVSKGAEFALVAASRLTWLSAVVAIVPSDVVWQGWGQDAGATGAGRSSFSFGGKPLPFVPNLGFQQELEGFRTGAPVRYRRPMEKGRAAFPQAALAARIRVEDFEGPMLVAGGGDDQMWDSGAMAQNIAERRLEAGRPTVSLVFPDGGHMLNGTGWEPTTQYDAGVFKLGGTPEGNARAQAEVWREALAFLHRALAADANAALAARR
ncbi:acyl-CoA thioester hydrolase/BAAT C-terminal domain-containing protein [Herbaspirillum sp. SJZ107]|uniref:acyl-CoA thioester hydrolase/BAAT C-terminal domain-containing protein n=1 Tax=Herbaspirillum sp. SJZ107 TaxID=2572881 RepID=UPI001150B289|nr:acyl-CoA thioester hydrolase/BAAT C-terminal domain-containing protein [Herbaspirillum sp. SJZ107]TQK03364.1 acyl-CoA thioester hydrolase/bile acid acetyltransferase-like protein [Herbaspirillum sp. SJZ107]